MNEINSEEDFGKFVHTVAKNNVERDGSGAKYVAESVITSITVLDDDDATLTTVGGDYSDHRITPTEVLRYTIHDVENPKQLPTGYRNTAVRLLANEIKEAQSYYQSEDE